MNNEEIDYWLRYFSNHNHGFMSEDGKKITLFKVFQELKELHYLLKIKNDYINELQQENQELKKENKILRENAEHNDKVVDKVNWENQKLKKQLEEANEKILLLQASEPMLEYKKALEENQQKEFIKYLTSYIELLSNDPDFFDECQKDILEEILSKYEEIIEK